MQRWEYMFVEIYSGRVTRVDGKLHHQGLKEWKSWLRKRGLEGWELASEVSFSNLSINATLKRPCAGLSVVME